MFGWRKKKDEKENHDNLKDFCMENFSVDWFITDNKGEEAEGKGFINCEWEKGMKSFTGRCEPTDDSLALIL